MSISTSAAGDLGSFCFSHSCPDFPVPWPPCSPASTYPRLSLSSSLSSLASPVPASRYHVLPLPQTHDAVCFALCNSKSIHSSQNTGAIPASPSFSSVQSLGECAVSVHLLWVPIATALVPSVFRITAGTREQRPADPSQTQGSKCEPLIMHLPGYSLVCL